MPPSRRPSPSHRALEGRRAGQRRLAVLFGAIVALIVILIVAIGGGGGSGARTASAAAKHHIKPKAVDTDPLTTTTVRQYIAGRQGNISAAVEDLSTGTEWVLNASARDQTASIIKADILETLMYQNDSSSAALDSVETDVAEDMIEASDNDDATALWDQIGGTGGLNAYNQLAGLTQTTPNDDGFWGETLTSAVDQIKVLRQLARPSKLLSAAAQDYQLDLMEDIDPGENWGVSGGVPKGVTVALKNGWVPLTSGTDWEVNSIGWIKGAGKNYLLAVLTAHDPSESYGIKTIDKIAAQVWKAVPATGGSGTSTGSTRTTSTTKKA